uniref:Mucin-like protein n=1 Tax=Eimeria tenella TaxID=5802 RepID=Q6R5M9_EIMTE|nr:mucin-like protein [Eimeria tenella]
MHALHSLILIAITAEALLGTETARSSGGAPRAIHQSISPLSKRRPGMLPAVSSLALLIATIVGFLGVRCYSSIKGHSPNGPPGQHKRNMAEGGQSPCLDDDDDDDDKFPSLKELGATAAPDDDKELGATAAPDDDKELGATAAPDDDKELGATAAPDDDKELGATAAPDDDKELGATAAPDDDKELGATAAPDDDKELGATAAPDDDKELGATAAPDDDKELGATAAPDDDKTIKPAPAQPIAPLWFEKERRERRERARVDALLNMSSARLGKIELQKATGGPYWVLETEKYAREDILRFEREGFDRISKNVLKEKVPIEEDESTWFLAALYLKVHEEYKTKVEEDCRKARQTLSQIGVANIPRAFQDVAWEFIKDMRTTSKFMLELEAVESRMRVGFKLIKPTVMEKIMSEPTMSYLRREISTGVISGLLTILSKGGKSWLTDQIINEEVEPWLKAWEREIYKALHKYHKWTAHSWDFYKIIQAYKKEIVDLLLRYYK